MRLRRADGRAAAVAALCLLMTGGSLWAGVNDYLAESGYGGLGDGRLRKYEPGQWRRKPCPRVNVTFKIPVARHPKLTMPRPLPTHHLRVPPMSGRFRVSTDRRNRFELPVERNVRFAVPKPQRGRFALPGIDRFRCRFPLPSRQFRKPVYDYDTVFCRP